MKQLSFEKAGISEDLHFKDSYFLARVTFLDQLVSHVQPHSHSSTLYLSVNN